MDSVIRCIKKLMNAPSILTVSSGLFLPIIGTISGIIVYDEKESISTLLYFWLAIFFGVLISAFFDWMRDYEETAKENRDHIREAEVISMFWKIKTFLQLSCHSSWPVMVIMLNNSLCLVSKLYGNITTYFGLALLIFTIFQVYCEGGILFAELYLDLEYVEERRLTDKKALKEELEGIWKNKITFKTEHREDRIVAL